MKQHLLSTVVSKLFGEMLIRATVQFTPACGQVRTMATLKDISMRIKAVTNIQKITQSMKMISAAKYARAEKELAPARSYGNGARALYDKLQPGVDEKQPNHLMIAISSDRGLCGAIHSNICRSMRASIAEKPATTNMKIVSVGDKARGLLQKEFSMQMLLTCNNVGKQAPTFGDAGSLANSIMSCGYEFDSCDLYYNTFKSIVSYRTTTMPIFNSEALSNCEQLTDYDSIDADVLQNYSEFALASLIFFAMKESACSEQSARMTAMDAASKNASEMIGKLTLTYNRTRQAVITRELIEIISGAAAL